LQIDPTQKGKRSVYCAGGCVLGSALDQAAPGHQSPGLVVTAVAYDAATGTAVLFGYVSRPRPGHVHISNDT
jgi:hypothetical protein